MRPSSNPEKVGTRPSKRTPGDQSDLFGSNEARRVYPHFTRSGVPEDTPGRSRTLIAAQSPSPIRNGLHSAPKVISLRKMSSSTTWPMRFTKIGPPCLVVFDGS